MPFKDRERQLAYMRNYRKLQRARRNLLKLKERKKSLAHSWDTDSLLQALDPHGKEKMERNMHAQICKCQQRIIELEGLLVSRQKCSVNGEGVNRKP